MSNQGSLFDADNQPKKKAPARKRSARKPSPRSAAGAVRNLPQRREGRPLLYLLDGPNMAFRAHYGVRGLTNSKGMATGALYGYIAQLLKLVKEHQPDYLALVWDPRGPTFREEIYPDYKGNRPDMPTSCGTRCPNSPRWRRPWAWPTWSYRALRLTTSSAPSYSATKARWTSPSSAATRT